MCLFRYTQAPGTLEPYHGNKELSGYGTHPLKQGCHRASPERVATLTRHTASSIGGGRAVRLLDGATVALPDTPDNQALYPQPRSQQPGRGFSPCAAWWASSAWPVASCSMTPWDRAKANEQSGPEGVLSGPLACRAGSTQHRGHPEHGLAGDDLHEVRKVRKCTRPSFTPDSGNN